MERIEPVFSNDLNGHKFAVLILRIIANNFSLLNVALAIH